MLSVCCVLVIAFYSVHLLIGHTTYSIVEVFGALTGTASDTAEFAIIKVRLPRAALALFSGFCFGISGVVFQSILKNELASPDIVGISKGSSSAAVISIVFFECSQNQTSLIALVAGLVTAFAVYLLSFGDGVATTRLILIGIALSALFDGITSYVLIRAAQYDLQEAMRWLSGSLNAATWPRVASAATAAIAIAPIVLVLSRSQDLLRFGDDLAAALGVKVDLTRFVLIASAVALIAFATAATGPIAFVAFLSGPIAKSISRGSHIPIVEAGLVGACLVLAADFAGQWAFASRYPVGVITGSVGIPYLIFRLALSNRTNGLT